MKFLKQYAYNWLVLFSKFLSVLLLGSPHDSISERTARAYLSHNMRLTPRWKFYIFASLRFTIDNIVFWEKNHTLNSISDEVGAKEIWNWEK